MKTQRLVPGYGSGGNRAVAILQGLQVLGTPIGFRPGPDGTLTARQGLMLDGYPTV
jgi:hypothetical protein